MSALKQQVVLASGLPEEQQILLSADGQSLNPDKQLGLYEGDLYLFPKDLLRREELVFNYTVQRAEEGLPEEIHTELRELSETQRKLHKLAQQALTKLSYFRSLEARSSSLLSHCHLLLSASEVVKLNHRKFLSSQRDSFHDFKQRFEKFEAWIQWELSEFDRHLETLRGVPLHVSLLREDRKSLGDLLDRSQLATWKNKFITEQERLREKVVEVENEVSKLEVRTWDIDAPGPGEAVATFTALSQTSHIVNTYLEYRELLEKYLPERNAAAGRRLFEEKWTEKRLQLKAVLKDLEAEEVRAKQELETQKGTCEAVAHYFLTILKSSLSSIAKIRDSVKSQISMLNSLLKRSEQRIQPLLAPKLLPAAYEETLKEVSRRFKFLAKADELRKELLSLIDTETALRSDFLTKYRNVLPQDFIPQIGEAPDRKYLLPRTDNDRNLPRIDVPCIVPASYYGKGEGEEVKSALMAVSREIEEMRREEDGRKAKEVEVEEEIEQLRMQMKSLELEIEAKNTQIAHEVTRFTEIRQRLSDLEASETQSKQLISDLQTRLSASEQANDLLRSQLLSSAQSLEALQSRLNLSLESSSSLLGSLHLPPQPEAGLALLKDKVMQLRADNYKLRKKLQGTIYFTSFPEGALALFFPDSEGRFVAFHCNSPNHFLDLATLPEAIAGQIRYPLPREKPFILGKIVHRNAFTASPAHNPFLLTIGTAYYLLSIEVDARFL